MNSARVTTSSLNVGALIEYTNGTQWFLGRVTNVLDMGAAVEIIDESNEREFKRQTGTVRSRSVSYALYCNVWSLQL